MKTIQLNRGKVALVDDELLAELSQYNWRCNRGVYTCYAHRLIKNEAGQSRTVSMHRHIAKLLGFPPEMRVDHRDRNGLNNQASNLRPATASQNAINQRLPRSNRSGYRGVCWGTARRKWLASITVNGRHKNLGGFDSKLQAARAYDAAATKLHGEFAQLNFPDAT